MACDSRTEVGCNAASDPTGCLSLFYGSAAPNSQAIIDRVTGEVSVTGKTELTTLSADMNGPIFKLPGGNLAIAFGAQVRREVGGSHSDHDSNQFNYIFLLGSNNFIAERKIFAGYAELSLPLFEGFEVRGRVKKTFLRGNLIVDGDRFLGREGMGEFLKRGESGRL